MKTIFLFIALCSQCFAETNEIEKLQKEKIVALQKAVQIYVLQYEQGAVIFSSYYDAQNELINAQFELISNSQERIILLTTQLDLANNVYQHIEGRYTAGFRFSEVDLIKAKVLCLDIKIKLLRELNKQKSTNVPDDKSHRRRRA